MNAPLQSCEVCGAKVPELRRSRCWGCYARWTENRPVGLGATCAICHERRRDFLKSVELLGAWVPLCFNCAGRAMRLSPMPQSLDDIRRGMARERRRHERRSGRPDTRVYTRERRGSDRRAGGGRGADDLILLDDDDIVLIELEAALEANETRGEETRIVETMGRRGS